MNMPQAYEVFRASGQQRRSVPNAECRADGKGGFLKRGFYYRRLDDTLVGPFDTGPQAELALTIEKSTPRLHESELLPSELPPLRALRRKGVIAQVGLYLTREFRATLTPEQQA